NDLPDEVAVFGGQHYVDDVIGLVELGSPRFSQPYPKIGLAFRIKNFASREPLDVISQRQPGLANDKTWIELQKPRWIDVVVRRRLALDTRVDAALVRGRHRLRVTPVP